MATTAASSGSFLITPNVGLMIWTLLLFAISMYVLAKLAFPRISEALDKRQHAIEESIDHAERIRHEADDVLEEYRERLHEAGLGEGLPAADFEETRLLHRYPSRYFGSMYSAATTRPRS